MSVNPHRDFERPALSLESLRPPQSTPPLAAEIRARLERGDITALNPGTASLDEQFAMETPFLPLILGPEFRTKNLEIVLPQIGKAITGDSRAAAFYLRHRIIPVASFANWAQKRIIALREESLLHIKFDDALFHKHSSTAALNLGLPTQHHHRLDVVRLGKKVEQLHRQRTIAVFDQGLGIARQTGWIARDVHHSFHQ